MRYNSRLYWKPGPGAQYCQALLSWIVNWINKIQQAATWIVDGYMILQIKSILPFMQHHGPSVHGYFITLQPTTTLLPIAFLPNVVMVTVDSSVQVL